MFALGKYGTRELSLDADLDIIFIGDQRVKSATNMLEKIATGMIQELSRVGEMGRLYDVDARLRPEGRSAPMVVDRKAYATYLRTRASLWERQSLTRLRFVCGNEDLGAEVQTDVESFVYDAPLPAGWADAIVAMRRKMETRSHTRSSEFIDVKLGAGGMVDVEFSAQMIQLKHGAFNLTLRHLPAIEVFASAPSELMAEDAWSSLVSGYQLYRRTELMMRLVLEERTTIVPEGVKRELLARTLGIATGEELHNRLVLSMTTVRSQFLQIAKALSSN